MAAACNRSALMGVAALPHIRKSQLAARPWQRRLPSHHAVPSMGIIQCRARDFSTLTSNPGKDGGSWDESIDSQKMLYLRRRIEDLRSQERATQAEEENYSMLYLRRRIEHVKVRELMMPAEVEERQLHDIESCSTCDVRLEKWMKWERDYQVFYQEEVRFIMARLQDWLLQCQPSFSIAVLLCLCVVGATGAFTILSTLIWSLFFPTLFYIWQTLLFH